jgi:hypothetical protein
MTHSYYTDTEVEYAFYKFACEFQSETGLDVLEDFLGDPLYQSGINILHDLGATAFPADHGDQANLKIGRDRLKLMDSQLGVCRIAWILGNAADFAIAHRWTVSTRRTGHVKRNQFRDIGHARTWLGIPEDYVIQYPEDAA